MSTPAASEMNIIRIIEIRDTRDFIEQGDRWVALPDWYRSHATCCDGWMIDGVHDASCHTTDGVYRCEECDLPFERTNADRKFCAFCQKSTITP